MKLLMTLFFLFPAVAFANLVNLTSTLYGGSLWVNHKATGQACYIQINRINSLPSKGKHCNTLYTQFLFNDEDSQPRDLEISLNSRKTNSEADFHKPVTCAEVVPYIPAPASIKWHDDTTHLYNQVFNAKETVNGKENHYTLVMDGNTKAPSHYMVYRLGRFSENRFECRDLRAY